VDKSPRKRWLLAVLIACCADVHRDVRQYRNEGTLCLSSQSSGGTHVQAVLTGCGSACARSKASCRAQVREDSIDVEAEGSAITEWSGEPPSCPQICVPILASCELPALPDGTYQLRYGDRSATVEIPVTSDRTTPSAESDAGVDAGAEAPGNLPLDVFPGPSSYACRRIPEQP
jgi:hypothetical protein